MPKYNYIVLRNYTALILLYVYMHNMIDALVYSNSPIQNQVQVSENNSFNNVQYLMK